MTAELVEELPALVAGEPIPPALLSTIKVKHLGPTWEPNPDWDGVSLLGKHGKYLLPMFTLGYEVWAWVRENLLSPDSTDTKLLPFEPTFEQYRFVLWWYAVDERGRFLFRRGVLQRLKGWGKDPLAAVISAVELLGPCRFRGWATKDMPERGLDPQGRPVVRRGSPVGQENGNAWIQVAAVTRIQTQNTMGLFPSLFRKEAMERAQMRADSIGIMKVTAFKGKRQIQAVTSNPRALEGGRPSLIIKNEALALDTPIPTPNGWTTMGELREGDVIFGSDGERTDVVEAFPVQEGRRCFKVTFATGDSIVASDGHWWKVRVANNRNCKLREMTTQQMFEAGREFWLPELRPVDTEKEDVELPIDPYILGLWLGDGHSYHSQIATHPQDTDEVLAEMSRLGIRKPGRTGDKGQIMLSDSGRSDRPVGYKGLSTKAKLRSLNLLGNKHVPDMYLRASKRQRLELLQGLMDSDGSIRRNGHARFCNTDERLLLAVRDLLLGLGYDCNTPAYQTREAKKWPDRSHWKPLGVISFVAYEELNPFRLTRKAKQVRSGPMPQNKLRRISSIEEVDSVPVRCIAVNASDHLFMAGLGMHVTRNTEHWISTNNGWEMDAAIDRNAAKSKGGAARSLAICNAPEPSEESIGLKERNAYLDEVEGRAFKTGVLYDSLELTEEVSLFPPGLDKLEPEDQEPLVYEWIQYALKLARGDAWWLDPERIAQDVLDGKMAASISRRFFFNQTVVSEESWVLPQAVDLAVDPLVGALRTPDCDQLRVGWSIVRADEPIVMFFDGSKSDDATSLTGCRLSDGYCFQIGIWQQPAGIRRGRNMWRSPRGEVDSRVDEAFERFNIVAFWGDPSHAKDDEDGAGYWDGLFDEWHRRFKSRLLHWSIKSGSDQHSILWDMSAPHRTKQFVQAAERTVMELETRDEAGELAPSFSIDGNPRMREHLKNAQMAPNQFGVGMRKESRTSLRKIDAGVTLVGARMLRRFVLNAEPEEEPEKGGWAEAW